MIQVRCANCGRVTEAAPALAGQTLYCAGCHTPMKIEATPPVGAAPTPISSAPPLQVAGRGRSASGDNLCSNCGVLLPPSANICPACGFDPQTGETAADRFRKQDRRRRALRGVAVAVCVLAAVVLAVWIYRDALRRRLPGTVSEALGLPAAPTEPEFVPPPEDVVRAEIARRLDASHPMIGNYQAVVIELRTGQVIRGNTLKQETPGALVLLDERQTQRTIPYDQLRLESRLRADEACRARHIEDQVRAARTPPRKPPAP